MPWRLGALTRGGCTAPGSAAASSCAPWTRPLVRCTRIRRGRPFAHSLSTSERRLAARGDCSVLCGRRPGLARAPATALFAIRHGVMRSAGVRCAASPSILAPMLICMVPSSPFAASATPAAPGIPDSGLAGPFPVGEYAAALRGKLRSLARVQLIGELVNLRRRPRARVLRAARRHRRDPLRGLAEGLGRDARARRRWEGAVPKRACRSWWPAAATTTPAAPPPPPASPSPSPTCAWPARETCWRGSTACASSSTPRGCSSARSACPCRCCPARSA